MNYKARVLHQHSYNYFNFSREFADVEKQQMQGWVILRDSAPLIDMARALTGRLKWDARVVEIENNSDEVLLICQKPSVKRQAI